jgi:predicted DNA-binding WGR domain protein
MGNLVRTYHLELKGGSHDEFWRLYWDQRGKEALVRWGKRGTEGKSRLFLGKEAREVYTNTMESKELKGYLRVLTLRDDDTTVTKAGADFLNAAAKLYPPGPFVTFAAAKELEEILRVRPWLASSVSAVKGEGHEWTLFTTSTSVKTAEEVFEVVESMPWGDVYPGAKAIPVASLNDPLLTKSLEEPDILATAAGLYNPELNSGSSTLEGCLRAAVLIHGFNPQLDEAVEEAKKPVRIARLGKASPGRAI